MTRELQSLDASNNTTTTAALLGKPLRCLTVGPAALLGKAATLPYAAHQSNLYLRTHTLVVSTHFLFKNILTD